MEKKISMTRMKRRLSIVSVETGTSAPNNEVRDERNRSAQVKKITPPTTKSHNKVYDSDSFLFRSISTTNAPFNSARTVMISFAWKDIYASYFFSRMRRSKAINDAKNDLKG